MKSEELRALIAEGETLMVEFKSDQGPLSDADLSVLSFPAARPTWTLCNWW